jgi:hypothetical protein
MPLDQAQTQYIHNWLRKAGSGAACPVCLSSNLAASGLFTVADVAGSAQATGPVSPLVAIVCQSCGHVRFFSATLMGLPGYAPAGANP